MPNVSNVQLQIEHKPSPHTATSSRHIGVNYQIGFTPAEVDARANFQVRVAIVAPDNATTLPVNAFNLIASPGPVARSETKTFQRRQLDDDADFEIVFDTQGHPHRVPSEMPDSWRARVMVTYVPEQAFGSATAMSSSVDGSWGPLGND